MMSANMPMRKPKSSGLSLLELLATIVIMGVIAAVVIPRLGDSAETANRNSCELNRGVIEVQTALWHREKGRWPAADLSDVGADVQFFPEGLPRCPVDGSGYSIDPQTGRVNGHQH